MTLRNDLDDEPLFDLEEERRERIIDELEQATLREYGYGRRQDQLGASIGRIIDHIGRLHVDSEWLKAESPIEQTLISRLRWLLPELPLRSQVAIGPYRADLLLAGRLVVECDGRDFHSSPRQMAADARRDAYMRARGFRVMRFRGRDIHIRPDGCVGEIAAALGLRIDDRWAA